jgi:CheY-like chemotaxis protein
MKRLLLVDDEVDIAETLRDLLESAGYVVDVAYDGEEGLRMVEANQPDLILTDIMMPTMTGPEMLERIRENPRCRRIPVIMVSAGENEDIARRVSAEFLKKPFTLDVLTRVIRKLLH